MNSDIRTYIDKLFEEAPRTRKALEMKEEMISNAEEKLRDYMEQGYREEEAMEVVINSIGNIEELFQELEKDAAGNIGFTELELKLTQKKAKYTAVAVGLYLFAGAVFFFFTSIGYGSFAGMDMDTFGLVVAILCCIPPTCLLVYADHMIPKSRRRDEDMAEEYRDWKSGRSRDRAIRQSISYIIWSLTVILYITASFSTGAWHITWVFFVAAGCVEAVVSLIFSLKTNP